MSTCPLFTEVQDEIIKWIPTQYLFRCRLVSSHWNETCSKKIGHVTKVIVEFGKDRHFHSNSTTGRTGRSRWNVKDFLEIFRKSRQILNNKMIRITNFGLKIGIVSKREVQWDMAKLFAVYGTYVKEISIMFCRSFQERDNVEGDLNTFTLELLLGLLRHSSLSKIERLFVYSYKPFNIPSTPENFHGIQLSRLTKVGFGVEDGDPFGTDKFLISLATVAPALSVMQLKFGLRHYNVNPLVELFKKLQTAELNLSFVLHVNTDDTALTTLLPHMSPKIVLEAVEFSSLPVMPRNSTALFAHSIWFGSLRQVHIFLDPKTLIDSGLTSVVMPSLWWLVIYVHSNERIYKQDGSNAPEIPKKKMVHLQGANLPQLAHLQITTLSSAIPITIPADNFGMFGHGIQNEVFPNLRSLKLASNLPQFLKRIYRHRVFPQLVKLVAATTHYYCRE